MQNHLCQALISVISMKGVILAAGEGTRIRKVTYGAFPKELLPIGNVPTIRFPIETLKLAGLNDIIIVIAPQTKHGIIDGLQSGGKFGINICYVVQETNDKGLTGLGQAILSTKNWIKENEDFVVACGDSILCDLSSNNPLDCIKPLLEVHSLMDAIATIVAYPVKMNPARFGVVKFRHLHEDEILYGDLENLVEKPDLEVAEAFKLNGHYYIITGYYAFKPEIFKYIENTKPGVNNEVQITDAIALALRNGEKVCAVVHGRNERGNGVFPCEYWDVGIPEEYKKANKRLLETNFGQLMSSG